MKSEDIKVESRGCPALMRLRGENHLLKWIIGNSPEASRLLKDEIKRLKERSKENGKDSKTGQ